MLPEAKPVAGAKAGPSRRETSAGADFNLPPPNNDGSAASADDMPALKLLKLGVDSHDGSLLVENPGIKDLPRPLKRQAPCLNTFNSHAGSLATMTSELGTLTAETERKRGLIRKSMIALDGIADVVRRRKAGPRNKYVEALMHFIVSEQVESMKERLATSPAYAALLKEQAEKRRRQAQSNAVKTAETRAAGGKVSATRAAS